MLNVAVVSVQVSASKLANGPGSERTPRVTSKLDAETRSRVDKGSGRDVAIGVPRLYTAIVAVQDGERVLHAFHAAIVPSERSMRMRVRSKLGEQAAAVATVALGFDRSHPMVLGMVSEALAEILAFADGDPQSPLATGLDLQLEQRFC